MQQWSKRAERGGQTRALVEPLENRRLLAAEFGSLITFGDQNDINRGNTVAVDGEGNVYVAGSFRDEADVAPGTDETEIIRGHGEDRDDIFLVKYGPGKTLIWAHAIGGGGNDGIRQIEIGPDGSLYVVGYFRGRVDFAPGAERVELVGYGNRDGFVARYTADGELMWAGNIGSNRDDDITALAVGPDGDAYFAGTVRLAGDIDPSSRVRKVKTRGVDDTFIVRVNGANGRLRWFKQYGEENTREEVGGLVVDKTGVYVTGTFNRRVEFERGNRRFTMQQRSHNDAYVGRLSLAGEWQWLDKIGSDDRDAGVAIAMGPQGDIYVTGALGGSADFAFGKAESVLRPEGEDDVYIARYSNNGTLVWARNIGEADDDANVISTSITVDDDGNAFVAGAFDEEIDFDPGGGVFIRDAEKDDAPSFSSIGPSDAFILKLSRTGHFVHVTRTGGDDGSAVANDVAVFGGNIYTTGQFGGSLDFEPGSGVKRRRTDDDGDESDVFLWGLVDE